jgi:DNA-binding MarR family transcriptional regulator
MVSDSPSIDSVLRGYHHLMRVLHVERARRGADRWHECPMTMPQLRALSLIEASQRGLSSRELAAMLAVGASAITPLMDRLVEHGFARRTDDPHDRRIARLEATERGTAVLDQMEAGPGDVLRDILAQLDSAELATVNAAFDVLHTAVQRATQTSYDTHLTPEGIPA